MKMNFLFLSTILLIVMALPMFGQTTHEVKTKTVTTQNDMSSEMGKPVFESTVDNLNTKVWILSQMEYKEMMKTKMGEMMDKMKDNNMKMDKETNKAMLSGTHNFIFDVTNITNGKEIADTSAKVVVVSPTEEISSVNLQPIMNHFGGGVSLEEKGEYLFTINLNVGTGHKTTPFKYELK
jgi:hypothetical protein